MHGKWTPSKFLSTEQKLFPCSGKAYRLRSRAWHVHAFVCTNGMSIEPKDKANHSCSKAEVLALEAIEKRSGDVTTQIKAIINYDEHMFRFENFVKFFLSKDSPGASLIDQLERGERISEKFSATNLILFNAVTTGDPLQTFPAEGEMGVFKDNVSTRLCRCSVMYAHESCVAT